MSSGCLVPRKTISVFNHTTDKQVQWLTSAEVPGHMASGTPSTKNTLPLRQDEAFILFILTPKHSSTCARLRQEIERKQRMQRRGMWEKTIGFCTLPTTETKSNGKSSWSLVLPVPDVGGHGVPASLMARRNRLPRCSEKHSASWNPGGCWLESRGNQGNFAQFPVYD